MRHARVLYDAHRARALTQMSERIALPRRAPLDRRRRCATALSKNSLSLDVDLVGAY